MKIAVIPGNRSSKVLDAIRRAGGSLSTVDRAQGLVWMGDDAAELRPVLASAADLRWVQLASAGIEDYLPLMDGRTQWCRAQGVQAGLVAEHALMLALATSRALNASTRVGRWTPTPATSLRGAPVLIVGGGAVARALLSLLEPFDVHPTVVSRSGRGREHGVPTWPVDVIDEHLPAAQVVVLAAPLTERTTGLIDRTRLAAMRPDARLINVGRGGLVVTDHLVTALVENWIAGAGLDVTEPEPLPDDHPLWALPNCVITAHSAGDFDNSEDAFAGLVAENVRRVVAGHRPQGLIDRDLGY